MRIMPTLVVRVCVWTLAAVSAYVAAGLLLTHLVFPYPERQLTDFRPGDTFGSTAEGFQQTVLAVEGGWVHTRLEIAPHAPGPPEHLHQDFEEKFTVREGTVSLMVNGEKRTLRAGDSFTVGRMTPHRPFNDTEKVAVVQSDHDTKSIPTEFAYYLSQIYPLMDEGRGDVSMLLQLAAFGNGMDTWIANGTPVSIQKAMRIVLGPTARLLGYRLHYEKYRPRRP